MRFDCGDACQRPRISAWGSVNQSCRGPSIAVSSTTSEVGGMTGAKSIGGRGSRSSPTGRRSPGDSGGGPMPERVSVLREPRTGSTAMPPRTAR